APSGSAPPEAPRELTVEQCQRWFESRNQALRMAELDVRLRSAELADAERGLLPSLRIASYYLSEDVPTTSTYIDNRGIYAHSAMRLETALAGQASYGTGYQLSIREDRSIVDARSVNLSPAYTTSVDLFLRQPLLRGLGYMLTQTDVPRAQHTLE